jgi:rubrerythrin
MSQPNTKTHRNLEAAFAGESMAHIKYLHFARIARARGDEEVAKVFEETAKQEVQHALGHAELLYDPKALGTADVLQLAVDGETYEYSEMYPGFRKDAELEGQAAAVREIDEQIAESKEHAAAFADVLEKARKRFDALARVEEKHANRYRGLLAARA